MKKSAAVILAISLMLSTAACSNSQPGTTTTPTSGSTTDVSTAAPEPEVRYLTLSAVASSSGLFPYCVSIGEVLSKLPELEITVAESGGNVANTNEIRAGEISIANSISNTDFESYSGTGTTYNTPFTDFRVLWYYESTPIQIAVAEDTGIKNLSQLEGQAFNPGGTGTAAAVVTHQALDALGINPKYFEAGQADAADAYANRQVVGIVKTGSYPDSYLVQANTNRKLQLLSFTDDELATVLKAIPSVKSDKVPAGTYSGVDYEIQTLSTYQGIQVDMSFSQDLVYRMWKAMWEEHASIWQTAYSVGAKNNIPEITLAAASTPLHAGSVQYLVEKGYTVPEALIPPEYVPASK